MFNLNDRYIVSSGEFVLSGVQAIVKLSLLQKELDKKDGLNTAGYVTGYRGSPLGTVDREFTSQRDLLTKNNINIATFNLGRVSPEGEAIALIQTDQICDEPILNYLRKIKNVNQVKSIVI